MEQRFSRPKINLQDDQDYAFFMSLLPSVKQLNQIEKMKLRMKIMNDVTDALEAHQFVKEVNSSRIIPSPIDSPLSSPYGTEGSEHSESSSMSKATILDFLTEVKTKLEEQNAAIARKLDKQEEVLKELSRRDRGPTVVSRLHGRKLSSDPEKS